MLDQVFKQIAGDGAFHIRSSHPGARESLRRILRSLEQGYVEVEGTMAFTVMHPRLRSLVTALRSGLTAAELRVMRAVFVPLGRELNVDDLFEAEPLERVVERIRASWLIEQLEAGNFTAAFQPIVPAGNPRQIFGYEALLRGRDAACDCTPLEVFDIARRVELVTYVDLVARETAIAEAGRYDLRGKLFLNVNPSTFVESGDAVPEIMLSLDHYGIDHENVVFELTETEQMGCLERVADVIARYRELGFGVALDDLGAGYASMQLLHAIRPEYVKLDMSLTRNVHIDESKALIARKLMETAHGLGARVVAEGVECAGELAWCESNGADFVQGFYVARPQTPPQLQLSA